MNDFKITLSEKEIPQEWYNVVADLPFQIAPPIHPVTKKPLVKADLATIFPDALIEQEMSTKGLVEIPDSVRDVYRLWRPTPLRRAHRLEKALKTKSRIFYKDESVSPTGSHKINTSIPQAYYNKMAGVKTLTTETGAGQWGMALSFACNIFSLACRIYMVKVSFNQKPYRKSLMHIWGGQVNPSPSNLTQAGRDILEKDSQCQGSLGIAISEAVEEAVKDKNSKYALGSVLNHVLLHQTVIGLEAKKQLRKAKEKPDYLVGCVGGGSNFAGLIFPFIKDKLKNKSLEIVAVEPASCPTLTKGIYAYDHGDTASLTPLLLMFTLGHGFIPPGIHAGGLRYHGCSPLVSALCKEGLVKAQSYHQLEVFKAAVLFAQTEGIVPAPETAHAIKAVIDLAQKDKKGSCIVFNFSGHGFLDLTAYDKFLSGQLQDYAYPITKIRHALKDLPSVPNPF